MRKLRSAIVRKRGESGQLKDPYTDQAADLPGEGPDSVAGTRFGASKVSKSFRVSEEAELVVLDAAHRVVVEDDAVDAAVGGQHAGLGLDLLGGENALHGRQMGVPVEEFEIAGELLHAVDV